MDNVLLVDVLVFIVAAVLVVGLFTRLGLSATVGYLVAGLAIGPYGMGLLEINEGTRLLGELGIVFLMFMVGLEFSLPAILASRAAVLGGRGLQVGLTVTAVAAAVLAVEVDWPAAVVLGGAVAMSSTAISLKQLADQNEIGSEHGRLAVGILLFQDLATLPFLVALAAWQDPTEGSSALSRLVVAGIALVVVGIVARPLFRFALADVARRKSADLFLLVALLLALGTAWAASTAGLSPAIGAFLPAW